MCVNWASVLNECLLKIKINTKGRVHPNLVMLSYFLVCVLPSSTLSCCKEPILQSDKPKSIYRLI